MGGGGSGVPPAGSLVGEEALAGCASEEERRAVCLTAACLLSAMLYCQPSQRLQDQRLTRK